MTCKKYYRKKKETNILICASSLHSYNPKIPGLNPAKTNFFFKSFSLFLFLFKIMVCSVLSVSNFKKIAKKKKKIHTRPISSDGPGFESG